MSAGASDKRRVPISRFAGVAPQRDVLVIVLLLGTIAGLHLLSDTTPALLLPLPDPRGEGSST